MLNISINLINLICMFELRVKIFVILFVIDIKQKVLKNIIF